MAERMRESEELVLLAKVRRVEEVEEGRGPYWLFLQVVSQISICQTKFYWPVHIPCNALWDGYNMLVATEQHVNRKFTFLLYSRFSCSQFPSTCTWPL